MRSMFAVVVVFALVAFALVASAASDKAELKVSLDNIKNDKGNILISVFSDNGAYYKDPSHAAATLKLTPAEAREFVVPNLPPGNYAIVAFHDANDDGKLNTFIGIPS